jgi:VWFA-related protein
MLSKYWYWGRRDRVTGRDATESTYELCYPDSGDTKGIAREMIDRRREKLTLDALRDLTIHLRGVREERKAVIAVSDGWLLYREDRMLAEQASSGRRVTPRPGVGPTGGLTGDVERARSGIAEADCERDRMQLSMLDNETYFRDLFGLANRSNVSFYPVDSRGLPVFDTDISNPVPLPADSSRLKARLDALQELAINTDGFAVVNSNDVERGLKRIADDLTSYYLLGYYSTNPRLDGRFRKIDVRVTRPGIEVRARRGYRAASEAELSAGVAGAAGGGTAPAPNAVQRAIGDLPPDRSQVRLRLAAGWAQASAASETAAPAGAAQVWAIGEVDAATLRLPEWSAGGDVDIRLTDPGGETLATSTIAVPAGARSFMSDFGGVALPAGEYVVRVRLRPASSGLPLADVAHVTVPGATGGPGSPRMFRRGPTTGPVYVATADPRFRRAERLRVEWPLKAAAASRTAELVDRNGRAMALPVAITERADPASGITWIVAEVALAPLAPGEYAIRLRGEAAGAPFGAVTAFRLVSQ